MAGAVVLAVAAAYVLGGRAHRGATLTLPSPGEWLSHLPAPESLLAPGESAPASTPVPAPTVAGNEAEQYFGFNTVVALAQQRAAKPYQNRSPPLPSPIARLTFDQYQSIRFRHADALWRNQSLFEVQFFHRGFNFDRRVAISEVVDGRPRAIAYNPAWFDFGRVVRQPGRLPRDLGYAGFRIHYPLHTPGYKDELIVFLGATFFRVLGRNQDYGLTARALAIDTASKQGEESPWFTDFWLVRPELPEQRTLTIYALLDSESVAGAYRFEVRPGNITQVEVRSELFPRRAIAKLGVAPMTSMFLYGKDPAGHRFNDYRPEVHDSDGLMMETGTGQWIWRPLVNPHELRINRFLDENPHGFGLIQRDRDFDHYQDPASRFQRRPSYWVQPLGGWGKGAVELVEIPTDEDIHDNIALYWVPAAPVAAGKPLAFDYLLSSHTDSPRWPPGAKVIATRTMDAATDSHGHRADGRRVLIDFTGGDLEGLDRSQPVKPMLTVNGGLASDVTVERLADNGVWRVSFLVTAAKPHQGVDLRCYLQLYGEVLTETWDYELSM